MIDAQIAASERLILLQEQLVARLLHRHLPAAEANATLDALRSELAQQRANRVASKQAREADRA
jgi:hypothetical protein